MNDAAAPSTPAVSVRGLSKVYRLYRKPAYRLLDMFGLCPPTTGYYTEHAALHDVEIEIAHGEKVAIIGRNGAGKSTLLKIITQTIRPTTGSVDLDGTVSALLQIGTGFHPDFTGRQNVYSGFAHTGITGRRADELFDEVIEFSELEEYIDQPMKTYSTGMCARLMFSASTVLTPDIFVIDELLGVGDAYFAHRSYERMRLLCASRGTTLLLVTHDVYSALNICDRFIWIDRGRVRVDGDGDGRATVRAYEDSIKEQEEDRLRRRNVAALRAQDPGVLERLHVRFTSRTGFALPSPMAIGRLALRFDDGSERVLDVAPGAPEWSLLPEGNLGPPTEVDGRACRCLATHGSIYHKAEWVLPGVPGAQPAGLDASVRYEGDDAVEVIVAREDGTVLIRDTVRGPGAWRELSFSGERADAPDEEPRSSGEYGTGLVRIEDVTFRDRDGRPTDHCRHGDALVVDVRLAVSDALEPREATFVIGFHREGVAMGGYVHTDRLAIPAGRAFRLRATLDPLTIGSGNWTVNIGFAEPDLYKHQYNPFFSVNERWHHFISRRYELQVESSVSVDKAVLFVHPASLELERVAGDAGGSQVVQAAGESGG